MRFTPPMMIRSALAMSILIVIACSALANTTPSLAYESGTHSQLESTKSPADWDIDQDCAVSQDFPDQVRRWCDEITHYAESYSVSPNLIAAVIWQESGGNPDAYSHSGAVGLMQIMPRDGLAAEFMCINGPCFASRPTIAELEDPSYNIEFGVKMLAGLYQRHQDWRDALKAYGPMDMGYRYADMVLALYNQSGGGE